MPYDSALNEFILCPNAGPYPSQKMRFIEANTHPKDPVLSGHEAPSLTMYRG